MRLTAATQRLRRTWPLVALALAANMLWLGVAAAASFATCPHHFGVFHDHQRKFDQNQVQAGNPIPDYFAQIAAAPICSSLPGQTSAAPQNPAQPCNCGDLTCVMAKASAPVGTASSLPIRLPQVIGQAPIILQLAEPQHPFELHPPSLAPPVA